MFTNPSTMWFEILIIVLTIVFIAAVIGSYIYKKKHHLPTGECECCHKSKEQLLKEYHKLYSKTK